MRLVITVLLVSILTGGCSFEEERALRHDLENEAQALRLDEFDTPGEATQPLLPRNPTLQDYLAYAALKSPALRTAYYRWQAAVEKAPQARALPNPKFSYTHYIQEVETRVGPQGNKFSLMQMVPWPTKLTSKADMAVRNALSAKYLYDAEKLSIFYRVHKAYAEFYYLSRAIGVMHDNMTLLKDLEEAIRIRYKASAASSHSLIQLQVELGKLEDRIKSLEAFKSPLSSRLSASIGRNPKDILPIPEVMINEAPPLQEDALLATLLDDNPGLRAAREKVMATRSGERLAKSQYFPDIGLGASLIQTDRRTDMNPDENGKDPVMVTVELSLPIWWNKYSAGVREARANRKAAEMDLEDRSNQLASDLRMVFYKYEDAGRKQNLFGKTLVPKAEQALQATRTAFSAGKSAFADLIDAERNLLELRLLSERAGVDRAIKLAELERLSGRGLRKSSDNQE